MLTIRAERRAEYGEGHNVLLAERPQGSFTRQVQVSDALDAGRVQATYTNGVLMLTIPVSEAAQARRIEVQRGGGDQQVPVGGPEQASGNGGSESGQQAGAGKSSS
jgi:HSP20 family protein